MVLIAKAHARFLKSRDPRRPHIEFQLDYETCTWLKVPVPYLRAFPLEPFLKVTATSVGIIAELTKGDWSLINRNNHFAHLNNFAHASMFAAFFLAALVEILRFYSFLFLPPSAEHLLSSLAFFVGELFYFHIDGRSVLDQNLHIFIYPLAFSISIVFLLEAGYRKCFILFIYGAHSLGRASGYLVYSSGTRLVRNRPLERHRFQSSICCHRLYVAHLSTALHNSVQSFAG